MTYGRERNTVFKIAKQQFFIPSVQPCETSLPFNIYLKPVNGIPFGQNLLLYFIYHRESPFPGIKPIRFTELDNEG